MSDRMTGTSPRVSAGPPSPRCQGRVASAGPPLGVSGGEGSGRGARGPQTDAALASVRGGGGAGRSSFRSTVAAGEAPGRGQALADGRPPRPVPALPCHCLGHLLSQPDVTGREHSQPGDQPSSPESASQRRLLRRRRAVGSPPGPASPTRSRQGLSTPGLGPATVPRALFQPSEKQPTPPSLGMVFSLRVLEMLESSQPREPSLPDGTFPQVPTGQTPSDWATDHARPALRSGRGLPCQPRTVGSVPTPPPRTPCSSGHSRYHLCRSRSPRKQIL